MTDLKVKQQTEDAVAVMERTENATDGADSSGEEDKEALAGEVDEQAAVAKKKKKKCELDLPP